jgi:hypothetical protein
VLLDAWQPHGAIWLPFGPLAPVARVLPGLDPRRRCRRERLPRRDAPALGCRHRRSGACRRRPGAGLADGHSAAATANVSRARVESGPDFKGDTGLSRPADQMAVWRQGRLEQIGAPAPPPHTNGQRHAT